MISFFPWSLPGGAWDSSHRPRCCRIFLITSGWSTKLMIRISPWHFDCSAFTDQNKEAPDPGSSFFLSPELQLKYSGLGLPGISHSHPCSLMLRGLLRGRSFGRYWNLFKNPSLSSSSSRLSSRIFWTSTSGFGVPGL